MKNNNEVPYANLHKITDGSNKFYTIYIREFKKNDQLYGLQSIASKQGFQVVALFGKKTTTKPNMANKGIFFTLVAATRCARRLKESKLQKDYIACNDTVFASMVGLDSPIEKLESTPTHAIEALFKEIPKTKPKMTSNQKNRFSNLIE
ncbi:hypothetical protein CMI41_01250 [Candidatus Pacearchaeota archaeon]|nr:hypothetical protein [Candidatus Pacearchaeota archaeon]|tara:strand:- start:16808 stop:17254 length:447 start_codon:yes stop_codon:yes gene_type:complete